MKYDAFVSYRHTPLDMEIAKKVHVGLETFKVPDAVRKKTGKKKIERVFRDQEELPIGSDLNDNISGALAGSEWLIVICSPRTPESYWVCKEIETFIKMHDREHVLAVLVEGEPNESFPPMLLSDEEGNPVEPLAADVRGESKARRNKKFKTELLRLAAPVLGCSYDDLRQRHRERIMKRRLTTAAVCASAAAVCGITFGVYNARVADKMTRLADEKQQLADDKTRLADEILVEYKDKQINQSRYLADESRQLLEDGDRRSAVMVAKAGLPSDEDERPYVAQAEYALANALYAYDTGEYYGFDRGLEHTETIKDMYLSDDSVYLTTVDYSMNVFVWDTVSWANKAKIRPQGEKVVYANADDSGIYVVTDSEYIHYDYDGNILCSYQSEDSIQGGEMLYPESEILCICNENIRVLDLNTGKEKGNVKAVKGSYLGYGYAVSKDKKYLAAGYYKDNYNIAGSDVNDDKLYVDIYSFEGENRGTVSLDVTGFNKPDIKEMRFTDDGRLAVLFGEDAFKVGVKQMGVALIEPAGKKSLWTKHFKTDVDSGVDKYKSVLKTYSFKDGTNEEKNIVAGVGKKIYTFSENNGELIQQMMVPAAISELNVSIDSSYGRVACRNGNIYVVDYSSGRLMEDNVIETGKEIYRVLYVDGQIVLMVAKGTYVYVLSEHFANDVKELGQTGVINCSGRVSDSGDYFVTMDMNEYSVFHFYDKAGEKLYTFDKEERSPVKTGFLDGKFICVAYDGIWFISPQKGEAKKVSFNELGVRNMTSVTGADFSDGGKYCVLYMFNDVAVVDVENEKCIYQSPVADSNAEKNSVIANNIKKAVISPEGDTLYVQNENNELVQIDISAGESRIIENDELKVSYGIQNNDLFVVSSDNRYLAIYCADGMVRIIKTDSLKLVGEAPLSGMSHLFMSFVGDVLIMQGSDYYIKIMDIDSGKMIGSYEADYGAWISYIVEGQDKLVACTGNMAYVFETESYGCVARVPDALTYFRDDESFICGSKSLYKVGYKNYTMLIEEAKRQFPDEKLRDEEEKKYNIK